MTRLMLLGALALTALPTLVPASAYAGPCDKQIAQLNRKLGTMPGLGGASTTGTTAGSASTAPMTQTSGDTQHVKAGSPGTVQGAAGPAGSTQVATSPEDVRRQSVGEPTTAAAGAAGQGSASGTTAADRNSQAKMALQKAVDLNSQGDKSCMDSVKQARKLMGKA